MEPPLLLARVATLMVRARGIYVGQHLESSPRKVGPGRVELPTSPLSGARSSQLSYGPCSDRGPQSIEAKARQNRESLKTK